ncbi:MAG: hypothetical protein DDT34_02210 [Firmicutes bacterium]|nr:hypothetical protein [Bacillota bacterium]
MPDCVISVAEVGKLNVPGVLYLQASVNFHKRLDEVGNFFVCPDLF